MSVFMNPSTKIGFRRIFGQEKHKRILIEFMNAVFEGRYQFEHVNYQDAGIISGPPREQQVIHSVFCTHDDGTPIIFEWQTRDIVENFEDRLRYFQAMAIDAQIRTVNLWKHIPLYVYILEFVRKEIGAAFHVESAMVMEPLSRVPEAGKDNRNKEFSNEMERMAFLQLPEFTMTKADCVSALDRWAYILKNMQNLDEIPWADENEVFAELAQVARLESLTPEERREYEESCIL